MSKMACRFDPVGGRRLISPEPHQHRRGLAYKSGACTCGRYVHATFGGYVTEARPGEFFIGRVKDGRVYPLDDPRGR